MRNERALQYRKATQMSFQAEESTLTNAQRLTVASIYDLWNPNGIRYAKDAVVRVVEDGEDCTTHRNGYRNKTVSTPASRSTSLRRTGSPASQPRPCGTELTSSTPVRRKIPFLPH